MKNMYAIMHVPTGYFLPEPKRYGGRGGSFTEPVDCNNDENNPRMFKNERAAKAALGQWLRGHHQGIWDYEDGHKFTTGARVVNKPDRKREHMKIIPFKLVVDEQALRSKP